MHERTQLGRLGEELVVKYLQKQGFAILECNYRKKWGEIDLIAATKDIIAFVEVKMRKKDADDFDLSEVVNYTKQRKIVTTAKSYLMRSNNHNTKICRFDVALVHGADHTAQITYFEDAFREGEHAL